MNKTLKLFLLGLMTWAVPFISAFFFFNESGEIAVDMYLFKTIMILIGGITGAYAIIIYFKKIQSGFLKQGMLVGLVWFAINFILDLLVLLPMTEMSFNDYFIQIGLRYLMIPIMSIMVGFLLEKKSNIN